MRTDLLRVQGWAGLAAVSGPGVAVSVSGPIDGAAIEDVLNELWNAGAEAVAVDDVRIVPGTVVAGPPGGLSLEDTPLGNTLMIRAIGSPEALAGSLTRIGGIVAQIATRWDQVTIEVMPAEGIELPATSRSLVPANGRPRI
jgi:uncharacterized protein YlxW (UPF0749 family)